MTEAQALRWLAVLIGLAGIAVTIYRARAPGASRPWLIYRCIVLAYFVIVYTAANLPGAYQYAYLRDGSVSAAGVIMLLLIFVADIIAERHNHAD